MATLIQADGKKSEVHPKDAANGFSLQELYALIGCETVQMVYLADDRRMMWMDEESKLKPGPYHVNAEATRLLAEAGGIPGDEVIGNVLIAEPDEVR